MRRQLPTRTFLALLALACVSSLSGKDVGAGGKVLYQWTDETGQVHFSDQRPQGGATGVVVQELPSPVPSQGDVDYSVESQAARLAEERRAREEAREEARRRREEAALRKAQLEAAQAQKEAAEAQREAAEANGGGYPVYVRPFPPRWPPVGRPPAWGQPGWGPPRPPHPPETEPRHRLGGPKLSR